QDYPFEELVEKLNVKRDMSRNPLFDTMFVLQNTEESELRLADISFRPYGMEQTPAKFDLMLEASEKKEGIQFVLEYATSLYERETIEQITRHFVRLAGVIAVNPDTTLGELEWVTTKETVPVLKIHQDRQKASRYWRAYLEGNTEPSHLPQTKMLSNEKYQPEQLDFDLGVSLTIQIQQSAKRHQVTLNTLIQSVWGILLQKYNGTDDVVFGSMDSERTMDASQVGQIIDKHIKTVPVRINSHEESLFSDLMKQIEKQSRSIHAHATYSLDEIQELLELKEDLVNHILIFVNDSGEEQAEQVNDVAEASFSRNSVESVEPTSYDFNLVVQSGKAIHMSFNYNTLAFERESIEQIQRHLVQLLEQVTANPNIPVRELDVLTE
ncbi:condensation domain-containing protein, partial [Paenibacillus sp. F4]|uniref:condensation domain-containing protein n=1 Tax=Paenibacillus sp. F4 TaxID=357385 RepID=UPI000CB2F362